MKEDLLNKASAQIGRKRYGDAIRLLEPEVVRYHDSFHYYYILAYACLLSGDSGGAHTYFGRAAEIRPNDKNAMVALALLSLRRGDTEKAIDLYLEILEKHPKERKARKGLELIRKLGENEKLISYIERNNIKRLFPEKPKGPKKIFKYLISFIGLLLLIALSGLAINELFGKMRFDKRPIIENSSLSKEDENEAVTTKGVFEFVFTEKEIIDLYHQAQRLFLDYRDEAARVILNMIKASNASSAIKNKADLLLSYATIPTFTTLKDRFKYSEVMKQPEIFNSCHVIWSGRVANIENGDTFTKFELLIGYNENQLLEGIVPVWFPFALNIDIDRPVEILGAVVAEGNNDISLSGLAIHQPIERISK